MMENAKNRFSHDKNLSLEVSACFASAKLQASTFSLPQLVHKLGKSEVDPQPQTEALGQLTGHLTH